MLQNEGGVLRTLIFFQRTKFSCSKQGPLKKSLDWWKGLDAWQSLFCFSKIAAQLAFRNVLLFTSKNQIMLMKRRKTREKSPYNQLADTSWPMIHCDPEGSKLSNFPGPEQDRAKLLQKEIDTDVILIIPTADYLYVQEAENFVRAYDPQSLQLLHEANLNATFPKLGGGTLDKEGYLWFTANNQVVRLSPDLSECIWSDAFPPARLPYNSCCFLPDGNLLVTSCAAAHVISSKLEDNSFRLISSLDLSALTFNGQKAFPFVPILPRPVMDESGNLYFSTISCICHLHYDQSTQRIAPELKWAFPVQAPDAAFNMADPILMNGKVYAAAIPGEAQPMHIYCLDKDTGALISSGTPFPNALQAGAAHTLGCIPEEDKVVVICNTENYTGGMAAMNGQSLEVLWHAAMAQIGAAFCMSKPSQRAYIIHYDAEAQLLQYSAINTNNGEMSLLSDYPSEIPPNVSLPSIGYDGRLYYPNPSPGFAMIEDVEKMSSTS